jgi:hypothetical protein
VVVTIAATTTLHDLGVMAHQLVGSEVSIAMGYPPKNIDLCNDVTARSKTLHDAFAMHRQQETRLHEHQQRERENDSRKKRTNDNDNIVDLTEETSLNDDEAYARRCIKRRLRPAPRNAPS